MTVHLAINDSISTNSKSDSNSSITYVGFAQPLLFWAFLLLNIPAILCSVFLLYHLLTETSLRRALQNHAIIIITILNLIYQVVDIPVHLQYFKTGLVWPSVPLLCLIWWFIDYGFFFVNLSLLMWASIERHIIIFHQSLLNTRLKRILFHYFPLTSIVLFILTFYGVAGFSPPCENQFIYTEDLCGMAGCYGSIPFFAMFERIGFSIIPIFSISIFSIALLVRVFRQKFRFRRAVDWAKQRKFTLHLISLSLLYMCLDGPLTLIIFIRLCCQANWGTSLYPTFFYISYLPILVVPIVCLSSLPKLSEKVDRLFLRRSRRVAVLFTNTGR